MLFQLGEAPLADYRRTSRRNQPKKLFRSRKKFKKHTPVSDARGFAEAFKGCGVCDGRGTEALASAEVLASSFVELIADVYARAEIEVCVQGDQSASASAWSNCFARAYARIVRPPLSPITIPSL